VKNEQIYRIGELARRADVTPRTVRYYESLGLLKSQSRTDSGQRYYTDEDLVYITRILQLKKYGLQLDEIAKIIKLRDEDASGEKRRLELLKQYRMLISKNLQHIKDLETLSQELEWHVAQLTKADAGFQDCPGLACGSCAFAPQCEFINNPKLADTLKYS
jgi:DNA-binding transcriptional MerR regulator